MSDDRTPGQKAADEALRDAIERAAHAYGEQGSVLTDFLVIGSWQYWDDDGHECTAYNTLLPDSTMPVHRVLGLAEYVRFRYGSQVFDTENG